MKFIANSTGENLYKYSAFPRFFFFGGGGGGGGINRVGRGENRKGVTVKPNSYPDGSP